MSAIRTITLESWPGHKRDFTEEQYVERWLQHVRECNALVHTEADWDKYEQMKEDIQFMARETFRRIWEREQQNDDS